MKIKNLYLRGIEKVKTEFGLIAMTLNLVKWAFEIASFILVGEQDPD
jgi:hypothetical protein